MLRRLALVTIWLLISWFGAVRLGAVSAVAAGTLDEVGKRGTLVVAINPAQFPYGMLDKSGEWIGFDADLGREFAKRLRVKLEFIPVTSQTRIPTMLSGKADLIIAGLAQTREREKVIDFSIPYVTVGEKLMVRKGSPVRSAADLVGKTVAVNQGSTSEEVIRKVQPGAKILRYQEIPQAFLALKQGLADAIVSDQMALAKMAASEGGAYEIVGPFLIVIPIAVGLREDDSKWRKAINSMLLDMEADGTYQRLFNKWFGKDSEFKLPVPELPRIP